MGIILGCRALINTQGFMQLHHLLPFWAGFVRIAVSYNKLICHAFSEFDNQTSELISYYLNIMSAEQLIGAE